MSHCAAPTSIFCSKTFIFQQHHEAKGDKLGSLHETHKYSPDFGPEDHNHLMIRSMDLNSNCVRSCRISFKLRQKRGVTSSQKDRHLKVGAIDSMGTCETQPSLPVTGLRLLGTPPLNWHTWARIRKTLN